MFDCVSVLFVEEELLEIVDFAQWGASLELMSGYLWGEFDV